MALVVGSGLPTMRWALLQPNPTTCITVVVVIVLVCGLASTSHQMIQHTALRERSKASVVRSRHHHRRTTLHWIGVVVVDGGCNALVVWFWFRLAARIGNIARIEASAQRPCKPQSTSQPNPQCNAASRLADQEVDGVWW